MYVAAGQLHSHNRHARHAAIIDLTLTNLHTAARHFTHSLTLSLNKIFHRENTHVDRCLLVCWAPVSSISIGRVANIGG